MKHLTPIRIVSDLVAITLSWIVAYYLRFYTYLDSPLGIPETWLYFKLIPFIGLIWLGVTFLNGFYRRSKHNRSAIIEAIDIIQSCAVATVGLISFTYFYEEYRYSRLTLAFYVVVQPILIVATRSALRKALRWRARKSPPHKTLIVATTEKLKNAFQMCQSNRYEPTEITGVILIDHPDANTRKFLQEKNISPSDIPSNWIEFLSHMGATKVFIALDWRHHSFIDQHLEHIANQVPNVKVQPDFGKFSQLGMGIEMVGGMPLINIHDSPLQGTGAMTKRLVDIVVSSLALFILSPIMLLASLLVKLSSPGPILYRQERMGLDGSSFMCLKFRSMPVNAESQTGAVWATPKDNRATQIGSILRKTSLDELPQLINVLKGEMSLVGPRPERPVFVSKFRQNVPGYMLRHKVKAGITGWAQVNGWRGNTSIEKRIECDLFYVQNWSLWLDFKILILTIDEVLNSKNAY